MINPVITLLVIPFLADNLNSHNGQSLSMPDRNDIYDIIDLLDRIDKVSNKFNKNHYINGKRDNINNSVNNNGRRNQMYDSDIITKFKRFLEDLNGG